MSISAERQKQLDKVFAEVSKQYGDGTAMYLGDRPSIKIETYSTGSLDLDNAIGVGGFPKGRISEVYAQESVGKTTIALHAVADAQRKGGVALFVDAEHALDPSYAQKLGVDIDKLIISQPDNGEQALEVLERFISSGAVDIAVVDSVAALVPQAELDGEMGDQQVGLQARLMSKAMRKLAGLTSNMGCALIFINQLRDKIAKMPSFGPQTTTSGGKALKYYASLRIEMARTGSEKTGDIIVGNNIKATVKKNKLAPPFKVANFNIYFGEGVAPAQDLVTMGTKLGVVKKAGAWYSYDGKQLGQGLEKTAAMLKGDETLMGEIRQKVMEKLHPESLSENIESDSGSPEGKSTAKPSTDSDFPFETHL